jgi:hypothetical protein
MIALRKAEPGNSVLAHHRLEAEVQPVKLEAVMLSATREAGRSLEAPDTPHVSVERIAMRAVIRNPASGALPVLSVLLSRHPCGVELAAPEVAVVVAEHEEELSSRSRSSKAVVAMQYSDATRPPQATVGSPIPS